jgi:hypothetical protein
MYDEVYFFRAKNKSKYDDFCSLPTINDLQMVESQQEFVHPLRRAQGDAIADSNGRFLIQKRNFDNQYYNVYLNRLNKMRDMAISRAQKKFGTST